VLDYNGWDCGLDGLRHGLRHGLRMVFGMVFAWSSAWSSHGLRMVFAWSSHGLRMVFGMVFAWSSHGLRMVFAWSSQPSTNHYRFPGTPPVSGLPLKVRLTCCCFRLWSQIGRGLGVVGFRDLWLA